MSVVIAGLALAAAPLVLLALALALPPSVPTTLQSLPGLGTLYLQLLRAAVRKGKVPKSLKGHKAVELRVTRPTRADPARYAAFLRLAGFDAPPAALPLMYPIVESFRLSMLAMSHPAFPFNVLGSVLARNATEAERAIAPDEALAYSVRIDPNYEKNDKGDIEIKIETTGTDAEGVAVWKNTLTVIVINPRRERGAGAKPAAAAAAAPAPRSPLASWSLPGDTGRRFGALTGDRNPIHLYPLTAQLFGFKRPIAHALYLVARLEASLANAGHAPSSYPAAFETEFKRPTALPAKLQAVAAPGSKPLQCAVLTGDGAKEVIVGRLAGAK
ncbi:hypothetical protein Rsub_00180 [Raphidocelis subcapitata]|uniref:MaoC-like domain-containing protein n=1 Tax=Raphidocelis subcapitata TaxID=307507 RepID=A0A2V0NKF8_9CHLO|nr:hypothetical protein Rsub_00180 [Raphidocelis subcapitata]|eukprot:GBF87469.1 hypothetical protein Rsub_00180 [Raphidocelis subcapitata]